MKTVIDWSKAPEWAEEVGICSGAMNYCMDDVGYQLCSNDKRVFFSNYDSKNKSSFLVIASRPEVKPVTVPTFTQAMADAGTLPSVGMECMAYIYADTSKHGNPNDSWINGEFVRKCKAPNGGFCFIFKAEDGIHHVINANSNFKPLTPPIELINGNAYQFFDRCNKPIYGIYNKDRKIFSVEQGQYFDVVAISDIKPLTLGVTS